MADGPLIDQIPDVENALTIVQQISDMFDNVSTEVDGLPTEQIGQCTAAFDFELPEFSGDFSNLTSSLSTVLEAIPDPTEFIGPIINFVESIKAFTDFNFSEEIDTIADNLKSIATEKIDSLPGLIKKLSGPLREIERLLKMPAIEKVLQGILSLGTDGNFTAPDGIKDALGKFPDIVKSFTDGNIMGVISSFGSLLSLQSFFKKIETWSLALGNSFYLSSVTNPFTEILAQFDSAEQNLMTIIASTDFNDNAQFEALKQRLISLNAGFTNFAQQQQHSLIRVQHIVSAFKQDLFVKKIEKLLAPLETISPSIITDVSAKIESLLTSLKDMLGTSDTSQFTYVAIKDAIKTRLTELTETINNYDTTQFGELLQEPLSEVTGVVDEIKEVQTKIAVELGSFFQNVRSQIEAINLTVIKETIENALNTVESAISSIETLITTIKSSIQTVIDALKNALSQVSDFLLHPDTGAKKQLEDIFNGIKGMLDALDLPAVMETITSKVEEIATALDSLEFSGVIDPVVDSLDGMRDTLSTVDLSVIPDMLKSVLSEAVSVIKDFDFEQEVSEVVVQKVVGIIDMINNTVLKSVQEKCDLLLNKVEAFNPAEKLVKVLQEEVYTPMVSTLEQVKPGELLKPIDDKYQDLVSKLQEYKPSTMLGEISEAFDRFLQEFDKINPVALIEPIEQQLNEVRDKVKDLVDVEGWMGKLETNVNSLNDYLSKITISEWLDSAETAYQKISQMVTKLDKAMLFSPLTKIVNMLTARLGIKFNGNGLADFIDRLTNNSFSNIGDKFKGLVYPQLDALSTIVQQVDISQMTVALENKLDLLKDELMNILGPDSPQYLELETIIDQFNSMVILADVASAHQQLIDSIEVTRSTIENGTQTIAHHFARAETLFTAVKDGLANLDYVKEIFSQLSSALFPQANASSLIDFIKTFIEQLNPADYRNEIEGIFNALQAKAQELTSGPDSIVTQLKNTMNEIISVVDILDISLIREEVDGLFQEIKGIIQDLGPSAFLEQLDQKYDSIIALLDTISLETYITQIDETYTTEVIGTINQLSPKTLLEEPLQEIFNEIIEILKIIDVQEIFKPIADKLISLMNELKDNLSKAEDSFDGMLSAIPL